MSTALAVVLAAGFAAAGWRAGALTATGALAATLVGTGVLTSAGWPGAAVLGAFFVSSSGMSLVRPPAPAVGDAKGDRRDHWQVLANGGPAALGALLARDQPTLALWTTTASLAAAAADTWATSIGAWSRSMPRHLLTWRPVPPGTSGGITPYGCLGAAGGALLVAGTGALAGHDPRRRLALAGQRWGERSRNHARRAGRLGLMGLALGRVALAGSFSPPLRPMRPPAEWRDR